MAHLHFLATPLYHATRKCDFLLHNVKVGRGWFSTAMARVGGLGSATTPYADFHRHREKENFWEQVRQREFPDMPSRFKATFLFVMKADIDRLGGFKDADRQTLTVLIPAGENLHIADAAWLKSNEEDWGISARNYWDGTTTEKPKLEALLDGRGYVVEWDML